MGRNLEYEKQYRIDNREKLNTTSTNWYLENKDKESLKEQKRLYYLKNKEKRKEKNKINKKLYYSNVENRNNRNAHTKQRKKDDPLFSLTLQIRTSINSHIKYNGYSKKSKTHEILGCSFVEFKLYLESKFEQWMTWENRGLYNGELDYGWDIDHIIPLSSANSEEDLLKLNHYSNLQPLCSYTNRHIKADRLDF